MLKKEAKKTIMQSKIMNILDEIIRFEELEKESYKEKRLLLNEIGDLEVKINEIESKTILQQVMEEVVFSFQKSYQIIEDESKYLQTEHNFIDITQTNDESRQLQGKNYYIVFFNLKQ